MKLTESSDFMVSTFLTSSGEFRSLTSQLPSNLITMSGTNTCILMLALMPSADYWTCLATQFPAMEVPGCLRGALLRPQRIPPTELLSAGLHILDKTWLANLPSRNPSTFAFAYHYSCGSGSNCRAGFVNVPRLPGRERRCHAVGALRLRGAASVLSSGGALKEP